MDRSGLLNEVTNVVAEDKVNIVPASVTTDSDGTATITATFKVTSLQQLGQGPDEDRAPARRHLGHARGELS